MMYFARGLYSQWKDVDVKNKSMTFFSISAAKNEAHVTFFPFFLNNDLKMACLKKFDSLNDAVIVKHPGFHPHPTRPIPYPADF